MNKEEYKEFIEGQYKDDPEGFVIYLNLLFAVFCFIGFIFLVIKSIKYLLSRNSNKCIFYSLYIFIVIMAILISIAFFGYTYVIENGTINVIPRLATRYLMLLRSLMVPLFIYGLYIFILKVSKKVQPYYQKILKNIVYKIIFLV